MSIITISRGTLSGGKMFAESLSAKLGYRCIDRDALIERAVTRRVSPQDLLTAMQAPPAASGRFDHKRYVHLALIQAALMEEVRCGKAIYHGLGGHELLKKAPALLRLRIIAPLDLRIRMAGERLQLSRDEAIAHIHKMDDDRRKWTRFLYGVDWQDSSLYDFVINLERLSIDQGCDAVAAVVERHGFEFTPEFEAIMNDLTLASRARADLALDPFTSNLEVEVEAQGGSVYVRGTHFEQAEEVERVVRSLPGVVSVRFEESAEAPTA
jgi:cytidylate kinase